MTAAVRFEQRMSSLHDWIAASFLLILAHGRPFTGDLVVGSQPLLQVMPCADPIRKTDALTASGKITYGVNDKLDNSDSTQFSPSLIWRI
jgi:hypothetical protein